MEGKSLTEAQILENLLKQGFHRLVDPEDPRFPVLPIVEIGTTGIGQLKKLNLLVDRVAMTGEEIRERLSDSVDTCYREGNGVCEVLLLPSEQGAPGQQTAVQRTAGMPVLRDRLPAARAATLLLQQPVRRLPDLPGFRQYGRNRPRSRHPGAAANDRAGPGRPFHQTEVSTIPEAVGRFRREPEDPA